MSMNAKQVRVIDSILSSIALGYKHPVHVGSRLFPAVPVSLSGGQVLEFGKESFKLYRTRRAPGAATRRIEFGYLGKPFALVQDALEAKVPLEHLRDARQVPGIDLAKGAINLVQAVMSLSLEYEQAQIATNAANYGATLKVALAGADKWSDAASTPAKDIREYREAVRAATGIYPNTLLLGAPAFNALAENPSVLERFKYTSKDSITPAMLAALFELEEVVVGTAVTADDASNMSDVWGNNAVLAYVPKAPTSREEPSYGYTYVMEGHPAVEEPYYDKNARSWIYPVTYERVPVLTGIASGFLIQNPN